MTELEKAVSLRGALAEIDVGHTMSAAFAS